LFFTNVPQLKLLLQDEVRMKQLRENVWGQRHLFTFDYHADRLIDFFYKVIQNKSKQTQNNIAIPSIAAMKAES